MASKHRPRKISEPTKTYNAVFPVGLLDEAGAAAELQRVSLAEFVREAVRDKTKETMGTMPWEPSAETAIAELEIDTGGKVRNYSTGVVDACKIILDSTRLKIRMATGPTIGEDLVARIKKDLGVE